MKALAIAVLALLAASVCGADLNEARRLMEANQPVKAGEVLRELSMRTPGDNWLVYDTAVAAYAAKDYESADRAWQQLAATKLPEGLRDQVWTQIGNVSYRKGEALEASSPEKALAPWEQSLEAYKVVLSAKPKDKLAISNKSVVELKLAGLHQRLAKKLLQQVHQNPQQPVERQIEQLQAALDHQRTAENLDPKNAQLKQEARQTEKELAERFIQKAGQEEKRADSTVQNPVANQWEQKQAQENLEKALADFQEAKQLHPENQEGGKGEKRVEEKLAQLLARQGRKLQQEGEQQVQYNPEQAEDRLEQALDKYEEALGHDEKNQLAKTGEQEVKKILENLHMAQGDRQAQAGERTAKYDPAQSAEEKLDALRHYDEAQELNPKNQEARDKAEALRKNLAPFLDALGQREQQRAQQAEPKSTEAAIEHLEKAATSYEMAQSVSPGDQQAKEGGEQVQKDLSRLRDQQAKQGAPKPGQPQKGPPQGNQAFKSLLAEVKNDQRQKEYEAQRRNQPEKYNPKDNKNLKNY